MIDPRKTTDAPRPRIRLWGTISGLLVFGLTVPLWATMAKVQSLYYQQDTGRLPFLTELALAAAHFLWIPAVAVGLLAIVVSRGGRRDRATLLLIALSIAIVGIQLVLTLALVSPLITFAK